MPVWPPSADAASCLNVVPRAASAFPPSILSALPTECDDNAPIVSSVKPDGKRAMNTEKKVTVGRLKRRAEFLRIAAQRCKWATPGLFLQAAPAVASPPQPAPSVQALADLRVGFTCSKKVGNAVARNRAKRRLRAVAHALLPQLAEPGFDYVLIGRQETLRRPYALLLQDLQTALKRVCANVRGGLPPKTPES